MSRYHITSVDFRDEPVLRVECTPRVNGGVELLVGGEVGLMLSDAQVSQLRHSLTTAAGVLHAQGAAS